MKNYYKFLICSVLLLTFLLFAASCGYEEKLTDNLFRNGMTIDELDEYFDLVTKKETFAPLFEGTETGE